MHKYYIYPVFFIVALVLGTGCAGRSKSSQENATEKFASAMELFERDKWAKAAQDFNWVVLNNPAGNLASEAQYYYAECLFQQKQYIESQLEFERLLRRWMNSTHLAESRYRIVQCLVEQSPKYFHDQSATEDAIDELQAFIDDFPESAYRPEAETRITVLRMKLARKHYESGRQYLKWRQPESARMYFDMVITQYYDTPFADESRVGKLVSFIIAEELVNGQAFLESDAEKFNSDELLQEARNILSQAKSGKFNFAYYIRLYH